MTETTATAIPGPGADVLRFGGNNPQTITMMNPADPMLVLRAALAELTPASSHNATTPPARDQIYAPAGHETALDPDRSLVIGGRGVGKSFWSAVLLNDPVRNYVANSYPRLTLDRCEVALGFGGVDVDAHQAPSREVLDDLYVHLTFAITGEEK